MVWVGACERVCHERPAVNRHRTRHRHRLRAAENARAIATPAPRPPAPRPLPAPLTTGWSAPNIRPMYHGLCSPRLRYIVWMAQAGPFVVIQHTQLEQAQVANPSSWIGVQSSATQLRRRQTVSTLACFVGNVLKLH